MADERIPIYALQPYSDPLAAEVAKLRTQASVDLKEVGDVRELVNQIRQTGKGMVLAWIRDRNSIQMLANMCKVLAAQVQAGTVRIVVSTPITQGKILSSFERMGVASLISEPSSPKAFDHKVQRQVAAFEQRMNAVNKGMDLKQKGDSKDSKAEAEKKKNEPKVVQRQPLRLLSDFWLQKDGSIKFFWGRWSVVLVGPSPRIGTWQEVEEESKGEERVWKWTPSKGGSKTFLRDDGSWFYVGMRPDFREDKWNFSGKNSRLSFKKADATESAVKFEMDQATKNLLIAKDSPQGEAFLPAIVASIEAAVKFAKETEKQSKELELKKSTGKKTPQEEAEEKKKRKEAGMEGPEFDEAYAEKEKKKGTEFDESFESEKGKKGIEFNETFESESGGAGLKDKRTDHDEADGLALDGKFKKDRKSGTDLDGEFSQEKRKGTELDGEFADETREGTELNGKFKKDANKGTELDGEFSDEKRKGTELDGAFSEEERKGFDFNDESSEGGSEALKKKPGETEEAFEERKQKAAAHHSSNELAFDESTSKRRGGFAEEQEEPDLKDALAESPDFSSDEAAPKKDGSSLTPPEALADALDAKASEALQEASKRAEAKVQAAIEEAAQNQSQAASEIKSAVKPMGEDGPTMNPLVLGFMVSELVIRRSNSASEVAEKFCKYLSAATGGMKAEIWGLVSGEIKQLAESQEKLPSQKTEVERVLGSVEAKPVERTEGCLIALVQSETGKTLGCLAISGKETAKVPDTYLEKVAGMFAGPLESVSDGSLSVTVPEVKAA